MKKYGYEPFRTLASAAAGWVFVGTIPRAFGILQVRPGLAEAVLMVDVAMTCLFVISVLTCVSLVLLNAKNRE